VVCEDGAGKMTFTGKFFRDKRGLPYEERNRSKEEGRGPGQWDLIFSAACPGASWEKASASGDLSYRVSR